MLTIPNRLHTLLLLLILIVGVAIVAMLATGARGGPLDPTSAPGSTDGVREPGTAITSVPFTITQPGYYYLTHNLTASADAQDGITVAADDVTLDLKGFTLRGSNKTGRGILAISTPHQLRVTNGVIERWAKGVDGADAPYAHYEGLRIDGNLGAMSVLWATVEDCSIVENGSGITADKSTVRHCQIINNSTDGLLALDGSVIEGNQFEGNSSGTTQYADIDVTGFDNVIRDNTSRSSPGPFVRLETGAAANTIMRNRYFCASGIVTNAQFNYIPSTVYPNFCF